MDQKKNKPVEKLSSLNISLCSSCVYKHLSAATCSVFPFGIPFEILAGYADHRKPYEGDLGVQYKPAAVLIPEPGLNVLRQK